MGKSTPGPWAVENEHIHEATGGARLLCVSIVQVGDGPWRGSVCDIQSADQISGISRDEAAANARLIAAAPDLLAIAQELQESASYWSEYDVPLGIVDRINAAIAKATGETA